MINIIGWREKLSQFNNNDLLDRFEDFISQIDILDKDHLDLRELYRQELLKRLNK